MVVDLILLKSIHESIPQEVSGWCDRSTYETLRKLLSDMTKKTAEKGIITLSLSPKLVLNPNEHL